MKNIIIEGLSGSGKSKIIKEMMKISENKSIKVKLYSEEETFGDFMDDLTNSLISDKQKIFRLENIIKDISENKTDDLIILERFHLSYYALLSDWNLYSQIDDFLTNNNFLTILLKYDKNLIFERALNHFDLKAKTENPLSEMINYFGSTEKAIQSYENSFNKRIEGFFKSNIKGIEINTADMNWNYYANYILSLL